MAFITSIIDQHKQLFLNSCVPSSIEMVLKTLGRLRPQEYPEQNRYDNRTNLGFGIYDDVTVEGVSFHLVIGNLAALLTRIDTELAEGKMPIISLRNPSGFHMWLVYERDANGLYKAFSKSAPVGSTPSMTIEIPGPVHADFPSSLQATIASKGGQSDILCYSF